MKFVAGLILGYLARELVGRWRAWEREPERTRFGFYHYDPANDPRDDVVGSDYPVWRTSWPDPPDPHTTDLTDYAARWAREHPE